MERLLADAQKISGVKYDIKNLGDVYSAIHVIQGELGLTGVAAEEAKTTLTGSFGAMKASWENTLAALTTGEGLETTLSNLSESVGNFANNILQMLGQVAPQVPTFVMGIVDALIANAPSMIAGGVGMMAQLIIGLVQSIPQVVEQIPVLFETVKSAFSGVDWLSLGIDIINGISDGAVASMDIIKSILPQITDQFLPQIPAFIASILSAIIANAPTLIAGGAEIAVQLAVGLVQSIPYVVDQIPVLWEAVKSAFSGVDWASLGTELINGIVAGVTEAASHLWETMKSLASSALSAAKKALGIASPSKLFSDEVGRWIPPGIAAGVEQNVSTLDNTMAKLSANITGDMARATAVTSNASAAQGMRRNNDEQREIVNNVTIRFEGSLAQLARVLHPYIVSESDRRGPLLIK